jgi:hypothetical protein
MFPTAIPHSQLNASSGTPLLIREYVPGQGHLSQERRTIVKELERIWLDLTPSEKNTGMPSEEDDLQYAPIPIKYSHTIEVTRNFVGEIPPQEYSWDDDD